jgi:hypothetical protein
MYSYFRTILASEEPQVIETADGYQLVPVLDEFHSSYDPDGFKAYTYTLVNSAPVMGDFLHLVNGLWRDLRDMYHRTNSQSLTWDQFYVRGSRGQKHELSQRIWDLVGMGVFATGRMRPIGYVRGARHQHVSVNFWALKGGIQKDLYLLHCGTGAEDIDRLQEQYRGEIQDAFFETYNEVYRYLGEQKIQLAQSRSAANL